MEGPPLPGEEDPDTVLVEREPEVQELELGEVAVQDVPGVRVAPHPSNILPVPLQHLDLVGESLWVNLVHLHYVVLQWPGKVRLLRFLLGHAQHRGDGD